MTNGDLLECRIIVQLSRTLLTYSYIFSYRDRCEYLKSAKFKRGHVPHALIIGFKMQLCGRKECMITVVHSRITLHSLIYLVL